MNIEVLIILLLVWMVVSVGCNDKYYFVSDVQTSDCSLDGDDFVEVLCKENGIDPNSFYRIECPKCPSGHWYSGIPYNEVDFGAYVERNSDGTEVCLFYGIAEGIEDTSAGTYCGYCGYQIGSDWTIFEICLVSTTIKVEDLEIEVGAYASDPKDLPEIEE